jgi:hypothetical protein
MAYRGLTVDDIKNRAIASFDTAEQKKREAARTFEAQQKARNSVITNMMRLRALREAKEAQEAARAAEAPPPAKKARKPKAGA